MPCDIGQGQYQCAMVLKFVLFGHGKGFGRLKATASLDAYQITKFQILQNSFFLLLDFQGNREKIFGSEILLLVA